MNGKQIDIPGVCCSALISRKLRVLVLISFDVKNIFFTIFPIFVMLLLHRHFTVTPSFDSDYHQHHHHIGHIMTTAVLLHMQK